MLNARDLMQRLGVARSQAYAIAQQLPRM